MSTKQESLRQSADIIQHKAVDISYESLIEIIASIPGDGFFDEAAIQLAKAANIKYLLICEHLNKTEKTARSLAFWNKDHLDENIEYSLKGTPCEKMLKGELCCYPDDVTKNFPNDTNLANLNAAGFLCCPVVNSTDDIIGHIAIADTKPLVNIDCLKSIIRVFATRTSAELETYKSQNILKAIANGFTLATGEIFFPKLTQLMGDVLDVDFAVVGELAESKPDFVRSLSVYHRGSFLEPVEYSLKGTPCETVIGKNPQGYTEKIQKLFPKFNLLKILGAEGYVGAPLFDSNQKPIGIIAVMNQSRVENVKSVESLLQIFAIRAASELERKRNEVELRRYQEILSSSDDFMAFVDKKYIYRAVNSTYSKAFDKNIDDIIGLGAYEIHGAKFFNKTIKPGLDIALSGKGNIIEFWKTYPDGSKHYLQSHINPYFNNCGEIIGCVIVARDMTDTKLAQEALYQSEVRFRKAIDLSPEGITLSKLSDSKHVHVNKAYCDATGYTRDELIGKSTLELGIWSSKKEHAKLIRKLKKQGKINNFESNYQKKNGQKSIALTSFTIINLDDEDYIFSITKDISQYKREQKLQEIQRQILEKIASHDDLEDILNKLCLAIESLFPSNSKSCITLIDDESKYLMFAAAPSFDVNARKRFAGFLIADNQASCGTAAFHKERVIVEDVKNSVLWKDYQNFATKNKISSCWSVPFFDNNKRILGTFAITHETEHKPDKFELNVLDIATYLASITVIRYREMQALIDSEKRYHTLYDDTPSMFFSINEDGTILSANKYGAAVLGYTVDELIGESTDILFDKADTNQISEKIKDCFSNPGVTKNWEIKKIRKEGGPIWVRESARVVNVVDQKPSLFIVCEDISDNYRLAQRLTYQATHDALTGLVNRTEFERRLERLLKSSKYDHSEHALCYLDLDQFKIINDTCGHLAGDVLLKHLSEILSTKVRKRDTLARLGGDEFGILMEHCSLQQAERVANTLRHVVEEFRFAWEHRKFTIGVSIGVAPINDKSNSITHVLSTVDAACYAAKDAGRNRVHIYTEDDKDLSRRRSEMQWVTKINEALENDKFYLYSQKIQKLGSNHSNGSHFELLLRMKDGKNNTIPPGAFLPAAERYNLASKIDQWVISSAFRWLSSRKNKTNTIDLCTINLSGHSLGNNEFLDFLLIQLDTNNIPGEKICFEITETAAIDNLDSAIRFIRKLSLKGCQFALDDFGSGVSSFGYLKNLPVDFIKIDGSFVRDIKTDPIDLAMVRSINEIAHVMGKKTIAEFVENDYILGEIRKIGVDYAQGFGISKPRRIKLPNQ